MEKNIKRLSIALIITTAVFFLDFSIGMKSSTNESLVWLTKITVYIIYALSVIEPILFIIISAMTMISLYKRALTRTAVVTKPHEKFPIVWVIAGVVCFIGFYIMTNILLGAVS